MADPGITERLQPSLLDRLTDDKPTELKETAREKVIDMRRLREIVLRDLGWLLNTVNQSVDMDPEEFPYASESTINFGIVDISGKRSTEARPHELERLLEKAITAFEPRIVAGSLSVKLTNLEGTSRSKIVFNIQADLWAQPVPMEIYMRSELSVASGEMTVVKA
ncbi:MAG: type VI secretion system baseplate subunit TssE [Rhodobacteraceae bacterium]|nr:type VI secretion system baseplate subunit TssE [Paracoccaceae bacterium]